jgi:diguanylate cyclase (GGDEF)-like protein
MPLVAAKRVIVYDPARRLGADLAAAAEKAAIELIDCADATLLLAASQQAELIVLPPAAASDIDAAIVIPRWIVGDAKDAARVAGAAATVGAMGVFLTPVVGDVFAAALSGEPTSNDVDLARARSLVAASLVDMTTAPADTLRSVANAFAAHDCIVWWRDGESMVPTASREAPDEQYRGMVAAAARISAACGGSVIGGSPKRSIIAEVLRSNNNEVAGLVAIVSDTGRRFSIAERTDIKAIAVRLTRELSFLSSHRRLAVEGERLLASSLHDPLTSALTRGAFEQSVTHEVAAAARRSEVLTVVLIDVVGLRRINLSNGHRVGDEVLSQMAARIRACIRGNDPMGRLGGDEIAVLLVGSNDAQATLVARKIIRKVVHDPIVIDGNSVQLSVRATMSEVGKGERSGEAAFSRCYAALRHAPIDDALVVAVDERGGDTGDGAGEGGLTAGTVVGGNFRVLHELSRGAMGVVYRGEDLGLGRPVAIKVLRSDLASDRDLVARFRAEAGLLASMHHNNLVQVFSLGEHGGDVYFVMELVEGQPLSEVLRSTIHRGEWFPTAAVAQVSMEIADALDAMHARGLIHRDVKPANILLDRDRDRAVLVDVGVAVKAGDQREAAGTPGFAAPESFLEAADSAQTDVYGLAATVYCMLTGRPPYGSGPAVQVIHRQLYDPLVPPSVHRPLLSSAIDAVLVKGLDPTPKKRWASASTFAIALSRALERLPSYESSPNIAMPSQIDAQVAVEMVSAPTASMSAHDVAQLPGGFHVSPSAHAMTMNSLGTEGKIRGAHFRVLSKILTHHVGEAALHRLAVEQPELSAGLATSIAPTSWQDLALFVRLLNYATLTLPNVPVTRQVGRGVITATFARMYGADPASLPIETVLAATPTFWPRFHDWGDAQVYLDEGKADLILDGYGGSPEVCAVVAAQFQRIVELAGGTEVTADHTTCASHSADACRFRLTWSAPLPPAGAAAGE